MCSTISTAYVHGGRPGVLPETAVAANEPPSLWHPLEPQHGSGNNGAGLAGAACANGHANGHASSHAEGHEGSKASVPGVYLDLESELAHAQVCNAGPAQNLAYALPRRRRRESDSQQNCHSSTPLR